MIWKIGFFEIEKDWEKELYIQKLKEILKEKIEDTKLYFYKEPLNEINAKQFRDLNIIIIHAESRINSTVVENLANTKLIITRTTGTDHIDIPSCEKSGILVANCPVYASITVAEHTVALMFALARKLRIAIDKSKILDFSKDGLMGVDLLGKTVGIIGTGRIGSEIARIAYGIGMKVLATDISPSAELIEKYKVKYVDLETLLKESNVIIVMVPYYSQTHHLINKENIKLVKDEAIFINTARGPIVDTEALIWALKNNKLQGGIAMDVFEGERVLLELQNMLINKTFTAEEYEKALKTLNLLNYPNVIFTPHVAYYTKEAMERIIDWVVENVSRFLVCQALPMQYKFYF
ncbi:MAG: hydroxyacid dehydrogenase [Thermodesulfobacterium geofontis]|uniref:Hydroxyacid dehydrogenase n=1 Tax=Thermodesulfobacterium geofontis TaxID=1295609 RepID=A0A2N7Q663_9BACT|nr:MAG: hydroxyacid dehydrogenase [Thermodesulfobacterium geofontis]